MLVFTFSFVLTLFIGDWPTTDWVNRKKVTIQLIGACQSETISNWNKSKIWIENGTINEMRVFANDIIGQKKAFPFTSNSRVAFSFRSSILIFCTMECEWKCFNSVSFSIRFIFSVGRTTNGILSFNWLRLFIILIAALVLFPFLEFCWSTIKCWRPTCYGCQRCMSEMIVCNEWKIAAQMLCTYCWCGCSVTIYVSTTFTRPDDDRVSPIVIAEFNHIHPFGQR